MAIDKSYIPKKIKEISSKTGIGVFYPEKDINLKKKEEFYKDEKLKNILNNIHEFDAYIAAYFAADYNRDIFRKAKNIAKDEKEYINILKKVFKEKNIEPISASIILNDNKEEKPIEIKKSKEKKRIKENKEREKIMIKIIKKSISKKYKKLLDEKNKEIINLRSILNNLSLYLLKNIKENDLLVPKLSFLKNNKEKSNSVFVDKIDEEHILYLYSISPKRVFLKEENPNIKLKKFYLVKEYEDLENFVKIKNYEEVNKQSTEDIDKIKEYIKKLIYDYR